MIKAIIFDCFGVFTTDIWMEYVLTLPQEMHPAVHELNHARGTGSISKEQFVEALVKATGRDREELSQVSTPGGIKNLPLLGYIRELKKDGYKIGVLSNVGSNWIREQFLTDDEQALFDDFLLSYEVNLAKPDPSIFKMACERLNVSPGESIMIDDIESYCEGATQAGLQTIVYKNFEQCKQELNAILSQP